MHFHQKPVFEFLCIFKKLVCRARGIDQETARQALVFSFGSEINQKLKSEALRERVENAVSKQLQIL